MRYSLIGLVCCLTAAAQVGPSGRISRDLDNFTSADWTQRAAAFYDLTTVGCPRCHDSQFPVTDGIENAMRSAPGFQELVTKGLISLLAREADYNRIALVNGYSLPEDYTDYNGDLLMAVRILRDKRSVIPLYEFVTSGNLAQEALAELGDESLVQALAILSAEPAGSLRRTATVRVIHKMAEPRNLQRFADPQSSRNTIKATLVNALSEYDYFARIEAIQGLTQLAEKDIAPLIANVAATDEYMDRGPDHALRYPVRIEAEKALKALNIH
jgi:hypothetical protein